MTGEVPPDPKLVIAYQDAAQAVFMSLQFGWVGDIELSAGPDAAAASDEILREAKKYVEPQTTPFSLDSRDLSQAFGPMVVAYKFLRKEGNIARRKLRLQRDKVLSFAERQSLALQIRLEQTIQQNWDWIEKTANALWQQGNLSEEDVLSLRQHTYPYSERPSTTIASVANEVLMRLEKSDYAVLIGRNNCGKSYLLKWLTRKWGDGAMYLGPARYNNFSLLSYYTPRSDKRLSRYNEFKNRFEQNDTNVDEAGINLQQAIAELSDDKRQTLSDIVQLLLGVPLEIRQTVDGNRMSQSYVSCGGHNISFTSSGFRLITALVTILLDEDYDTFLIDEPELGISPEAQGVVADFLQNAELRRKYFPHIKTLLLATHSTIFLDRRNIRNNYRVSKVGDVISIDEISSQAEFNKIHFSLLGNRFETLYLPSAILLVEGPSDHAFIERVLSCRYPNYQFSVIHTSSDGRVKELLHMARGLFTDIQRSPYQDRIFVVLDSVHSSGLVSYAKSLGLSESNIVIWSKNGIEYVYPPAVLDEIFGAGGELEINGDEVKRNGLRFKKAELCKAVIAKLSASTSLADEFSQKLIAPLQHALGIEQR